MIRILDMLIARTFLRIFALFILGAPLLFIIGDLVEQVARYFDRGLTVGEIASPTPTGSPSSCPGPSRSRR